jgi:hypothetical protein
MRASAAAVSMGLLSLTLGLATAGHAETTQCTPIAALPANIAQSGIYCLTSDFTVQMDSDVAIYISAHNVVLDLNGHTIDNLKAGAGTSAYGIHGFQRRNVVVKNGTLRGFAYAVFANDVSPFTKSQEWIIEDVRVGRGTQGGLMVYGRDCLVRRNVVVSTGGSTLSPDATAIILAGPRHRAIENDVMTVTAQGAGVSAGITFGANSDNGIALGNRVSETRYGVSGPVSVKFRDNLTTGVTTPFSGGTDAGNNN